MANWGLIGFLGIATIGVVGSDYVAQTRMAGLPLGEIGMYDYVAAVGVPHPGHSAALAMTTESMEADPGLLAYLPPAPAGWERRTWAEGDNSWVHKARLSEDDFKTGDNPVITAYNWLVERRDLFNQRRALSDGWIYEQGDQVVYISAEILDKGSNNSLLGRAAKAVSNTFNPVTFQSGYTVVDGVPFAEERLSFETKRLYRSFEGRIGYGQEVRIRVRAHSSENALRDLLAGIDYAGLNSLLDTPMAGIGPDMPQPGGVAAETLAGYAFAIRYAMQDMSRADAERMMQNGGPMQQAITFLANGTADPQILAQTNERDRAELLAMYQTVQAQSGN